MASEDGSRVWAIVGKVSAIVALIIGLVTVYKFVSPDAPSVLCRCTAAIAKAGEIHADLKAALSEQRKSANETNIAKRLRDAQFKAPETGPGIDGFAGQLAESIWPRSIDELLIRLDSDRTILDCRLTNTGNRQATDVTIRLPFEIAGAALDDVTTQIKLLPGKRVQLGILKPNDTVRLYMWVGGTYSEILSDREFLISYAEGVGEVQIAKPTYGFVAATAGSLNFLLGHPIYSLFMIALLLLSLAGIAVNAWRSAVAKRVRDATSISRRRPNSEEPELTKSSTTAHPPVNDTHGAG